MHLDPFTSIADKEDILKGGAGGGLGRGQEGGEASAEVVRVATKYARRLRRLHLILKGIVDIEFIIILAFN